MFLIDLTADQLISALLGLSTSDAVCILDSCGVGHLGSHLLIAGIRPKELVEISNDDSRDTLRLLDEKLSGDAAAIFTLSYEFGTKLEKINRREKEHGSVAEPDVFLTMFDALIVHDYDSKKTYLAGDQTRFKEIEAKLTSAAEFEPMAAKCVSVTSNFTEDEYLKAVVEIQERIRRGDTYQTNLTQQLTAELTPETKPQDIFHRLRKDHPAPFAAFVQRKDSTVISASPERFIRIEDKKITTSPIKGTRPRGMSLAEDEALKRELLSSKKDIAENTMIVDLLRNDLGRICEFGSVRVEKLCDLEQHPTLFHLVSTVSGKLRDRIAFSDILKAVFPCGSITGAPKISTMRIIDEIETAERGLSMGAIGIYLPGSKFQVSSSKPTLNFQLSTHNYIFDLSVAIRTMVVRDNKAVFNVGGGIVIDSDPESEYEESLLKAKALLDAISAGFGESSQTVS